MLIIDVEQVIDNPYQRRSDYADVVELADRIAAAHDTFATSLGLMQIPLGRLVYATTGEAIGGDALAVALSLVDERGMPDGLRVQLAFGHRRLRAFRNLHERDAARWPGMPVQVIELTDQQMLDAVWAENRERRDISAVEEAELLKLKLDLVPAGGGGQAAVAEAWGLSRPTIANRLRLLDLPWDVQAANRAGQLSERQCLALLPIFDIQAKLVDCQVQWAPDKDANPNQLPMGLVSPRAFADYVVGHPDDVSSDMIREYRSKLLRRVGAPLPDVVAGTAITDDSVEQPLCKGCPFRVDQSCLRVACLTAKRAAVAAEIAQAAATEFGLPYSDDPSHFSVSGAAAAIHQLYKVGRTENLVIGWSVDSYAYRPYRDALVWVGSTSVFDTDGGRNGVAIGHKHGRPLLQEMAGAYDGDAEKREVEDAGGNRPTDAAVRSWSSAYRAYFNVLMADTRARFVTWVNEMLTEPSMRPLMALTSMSPETGDDAMNTALAQLWTHQIYQWVSSGTDLAEFLEAAGWSSTVLDGRWEYVHVLCEWFSARRPWEKGDYVRAVLEADLSWEQARQSALAADGTPDTFAEEWLPVIEQWLPVAVAEARAVRESVALDEEE